MKEDRNKLPNEIWIIFLRFDCQDLSNSDTIFAH